ncbi:MAG: MmgE/PrpD family protein [Qingshengfaniella sp.]
MPDALTGQGNPTGRGNQTGQDDFPDRQGLTDQIAHWIADQGSHPMTGSDRATASLGFADCIAVLHAGWSDPVACQLRRIAGISGWNSPLAVPHLASGTLALHLAVAAHVLDYDDTAFGCHPSAVLVPTLLAAVAHRPVSGARLLAAYAAGYETWAELSAREPASVHRKGWHPSAVYGPVAATAALCALEGCAADITGMALSLAASMSGGLVAQFGTAAKPWQLGRAAAAGHEALDLAQAGMRAAPDALEHPLGFLAALSPDGQVRRGGPVALGAHMGTYGLNLKLYPTCYAMHRALDGMAALRPKLPPLDQIHRVLAEIGATQAQILRHHHPETGAQARFSLEFGLAAMLLRGRLGLAELEEAFIASPEIRALLPKITTRQVEGRHALEPSLTACDRVIVETAQGTLDSGPVALPLGHFTNPAPGIDSKLNDCLTASPLDPDQVAKLLRLLDDPGAMASTAALVSPITEAPLA